MDLFEVANLPSGNLKVEREVDIWNIEETNLATFESTCGNLAIFDARTLNKLVSCPSPSCYKSA